MIRRSISVVYAETISRPDAPARCRSSKTLRARSTYDLAPRAGSALVHSSSSRCRDISVVVIDFLQVLHDLRTLLVFLDAVVEGVCERLLIFFRGERPALGLVGDEKKLDENARHARPDEHEELGLLDSKIPYFTIAPPHLGYNGTLQAVRERNRVFELQVLDHVAQDKLEV